MSDWDVRAAKTLEREWLQMNEVIKLAINVHKLNCLHGDPL